MRVDKTECLFLSIQKEGRVRNKSKINFFSSLSLDTMMDRKN